MFRPLIIQTNTTRLKLSNPAISILPICKSINYFNKSYFCKNKYFVVPRSQNIRRFQTLRYLCNNESQLGEKTKVKNKSKQFWNLPPIDTFIEDGVVEIKTDNNNNNNPVSKSKDPVEGKNIGDVKILNDLELDEIDKSSEKKDSNFENLLVNIDPEQRKGILSKLDEKGVSVLKRRPELQERLYEMLKKDHLIEDLDETENYEEEDGKILDRFNSQRVPKGWRDDPDLPPWKRQIYALREKFKGDKWSPRKKLSREAMEGIRVLKQYSPHLHSGEIAAMFQVSPESIRRILKAKWKPTDDEMGKIADRWNRRGDRVKSILKKERREQHLLEVKQREEEKALEMKYYNSNSSNISPGFKKGGSKQKSKSKSKTRRNNKSSKKSNNDNENDPFDDDYSDVTGKLGSQIF